MKQRHHDKLNFINNIENWDNRVGWLVLLIYVATIALISYFHEPWFDEAQSWIIARDVSIKDIIFIIPHYEGHPPLWHLYLAPFAKLGMPYELGINLASILVNTVSIALIIFKAPFKKVIRYVIPFTYYFFFLYGVVNRCYSFTMLGFILMGITYQNRNTNPFKYILSMMLVCASTAYGLFFCAGVAIVWMIEIIKEGKLKDFISRFIKDKRLIALGLLLIYALILILLIIPRENTFAANLKEYQNPLILRWLYMFVLAPLDATFFTSISGNYTLMYCEIKPSIIIVGFLLFSLFSFILYLIGKSYKKLLILILPYSFFALFAGSVYFTEHHLSIIAYFLLFWFWICFDTNEKFKLPQNLVEKFSEGELNNTKKIVWIFPAILLAFPLYWNISTCVMETQIDYSAAQEIAEFIEINQLEDSLIMAEWISDRSGNNLVQTNINYQFTPAVLAYFHKNIIYNFNDGDDALCYNTHFIPTSNEIAAAYASWRNLGAPHILIGNPDLYSVFQGQITLEDYTLVKVINQKRVSKDDFQKLGSLLRIYARNDLVDYYDFTEENEDYWLNVLLGKIKLP